MRYLIIIFSSLILFSCNSSKSLVNENYKNDKDSSLVKSDIILDIDGDGILDKDDNCPYEFGYLDNNGCPVINKDSVIVLHSESIVREKEKNNKPDYNPKSVEKEKNESKLVVKDKTTQSINPIVNTEAGIMAYSVPEEMKVGNTYNIKLRISKENNKVQLIHGDRNIPINDVSVKSVVTIESVRVEPIMSAKLISQESNFEIIPSSTEIQNIEDKGYTEWQWLIKPLKGGENFLKLVVKVRVKEDNQEFYKDITVFDKKISVKSNVVFTTESFISKYWQWIMTTIIIPLIIWFYKKKSEEKKVKS